VRVGIVSGFFFQHSVWKCVLKGWMKELDRTRFQLFGYYTATTHDAVTDTAQALCARFVQGVFPIDRWRQTILADAPHVLIYPELGMDPICPQLASQRLAPVQCSSWAHPETSGFSTIDYFLSSDLMEPPDGAGHYTEKLIRLPNLSGFYEPSDTYLELVPPPDFGIQRPAVAYWCPQALYKYIPQFDHVFPRIAQGIGACQFVFIQDKSAHVTETFWKRLEQSFKETGLNAADHCLFLARLDHASYIAANRQCDIVLDSIGWSGGVTSLESLPHHLPFVTMAGKMMRGRHTAAFLRMMGVTETIAGSIEEYVAIAIRLARDVTWRMEMKEKIRAREHLVYRDRDCIRGLERFLDDVTRSRGQG
jgi:protein O-GlcNAc transferase